MRELARAKVNLCLHVTGQRADGYHLLDSLVVFPAVGDVVEAEPARGLGLSIDGPFGAALCAGPDNLVLRAAEALGAGRGAALRLTKRLPVASGIGGGSADAAAALRLLSQMWGVPLPPDRGLSLGADVPVCLDSGTVRMNGIGEDLSTVPAMPPAVLLLVNDGTPVSTPEVFTALTHKDNPPLPPFPAAFGAVDQLADWLAETRNDLEPPARAVTPSIDGVLARISAHPGCLLARMSGSGGTCFGLFAGEAEALAAQAAIFEEKPAWWSAIGAL